MIYPGPLTPEQRRESQKNYERFGIINGLSYMCLGETVIILFAVRLNASNALIAVLGSMIFFSYLLLPLGKMVTAHVGAARSQAIFWTLRNMAALVVAASSVVAYAGYPELALLEVLVGACVFYGFRAAGAVMIQPLLGDIATRDERSELVGRSNALFYIGSVAALLAIWGVFQVFDTIWALTGIIVVGACLGVTSTRYIRRIDETSALRESARRPMWSQMHRAWTFPALRRLIGACFMINLAIIMMVPVSMLAVKRGYLVSDTQALLFSLVQFLSAAVFSFTSGRLVKRFGARTMIKAGYWALLSIAVLWAAAPRQLSYCYAPLIFIPAGGAGVVAGNAVLHYFLAAMPIRIRVAASMLMAVITGVGPGVAGMLLSGGIFKGIARIGENWEPLSTFKVYFLLALALLALAARVVYRLPPEPEK